MDPRSLLASQYENDLLSTGGASGPAGGVLTGTYPNPSLSTTTVTPGIYTNADVTIGADGRITAAANGSTAPTGAAGGDLQGNYPNPTLKLTAVTNGSYGSATEVATFTVDAKGRLTAAANVAISGAPSGPAGGDLTGTYPNPTVAKLQTYALAATAPGDGQVMAWDVIAPGWRPQGNPVYYGTGTQLNSGTSTVTIGPNSTTLGGTSSVAVGNAAVARALSSVAIGPGATASTTGTNSVAVGSLASATAVNAVSVGPNAIANATTSTAVGSGATCSTTGTAAAAFGGGSSATGVNSLAIGSVSVASAESTTAIGRNSLANTAYATSIGAASSATALSATGIGVLAVASGGSSVAIGDGCQSAGADGTAAGHGASASTTSATSYGALSLASGVSSTAVGRGATASATSATSLGNSANASASTSTALGVSSVASMPFSTAVGDRASATGSAATALGLLSSASASEAIALGRQTVANVANGIAVGNAATTNSIASAISLGAAASPLSTANSFALAINSASVVPGTLGITLNGAAKVLDAYTSLYSTTAGAGPTVLTATSSKVQVFTTSQTVTLPVTSTLQLGFTFRIINQSAGVVTVQSSGANTVLALGASTSADFVCVLTSGTTAASWYATTIIPGGTAGGDLTGTYPNPTLATFGPGAVGPIGDSTNVAAVTTDAKGRISALTSVPIAFPSPVVYSTSVNLTLAQWQNMFTTPVLVIAAPGASLYLIVHRWVLEMTYGSANTAGGGNINLIYTSTPTTAGATITSTFSNGATTNRIAYQNGDVNNGVDSTATMINNSISIRNFTAAFTGGTGATFTVNVIYSINTF